MKRLSSEEIKLKLKRLIAAERGDANNVGDIADDVSLYEDGIGLDSISVVNLIVAMETDFKMSFDDDQVNSAIFRSVNSLSQFIESKQK